MKLQPFEPFKAMFVDRLIKLNKKFLVTQSYAVAYDNVADRSADRIPLLLTDYEDLSRAKTHWNAVKANDKYAAIIHLELEAHRNKLFEMLKAGSSYQLFFAVVKSATELEHQLNLRYKDHMRRWIDTHTTWRITRDAAIRPSLQLVFGVLYINLKYAGHRARIKFEELEKV